LHLSIDVVAYTLARIYQRTTGHECWHKTGTKANTDGCGRLENKSHNLTCSKNHCQLTCNAFVFVASPQRGWTALHWAAKCGHLDVAKLLLEKGARLDEKNNVCTSALLPVHHALPPRRCPRCQPPKTSEVNRRIKRP